MPKELFDEASETFIYVPEEPFTIKLEYSLLAISVWESKWQVPFFNRKLKPEEMIDLIQCMSLSGELNIDCFTQNDFESIIAYMNDPYSATTILRDDSAISKILTTEVVYASMAARHIPFTCETWNINRLFKVIEVYDESSKEPKKMTQREIMEQNKALNAERRKKYNTKG